MLLQGSRAGTARGCEDHRRGAQTRSARWRRRLQTLAVQKGRRPTDSSAQCMLLLDGAGSFIGTHFRHSVFSTTRPYHGSVFSEDI